MRDEYEIDRMQRAAVTVISIAAARGCVMRMKPYYKYNLLPLDIRCHEDLFGAPMILHQLPPEPHLQHRVRDYNPTFFNFN